MHEKTLRTTVAALLLLGLLMSFLLPAFAAEPEETEEEVREFHITDVDRFLTFAENCRLDSYSQELVVYLDRDLDLTDVEFSGIPIFEGRFEGNHHTVSGLKLTGSGSNLGLFRFLTESAQVRDLTVRGTLEPQGSQLNIGGIAGTNAGRILNCLFEGQITGKDMVGGIAGINQVSGVIEHCRVSGSISAYHFIGGIAGENDGVIRDCINHARINTTAKENTVNVTSISMETITGTEAANTVTDVGGIAGTSAGVIRSCINQGEIGYLHMGYNIGGIAGSQAGYIDGCQNYGDIYGRKETGGIVGQFEPVSQVQYKEDTLQILEKQLSGASSALNQASYNAQNNIGSVGDSIDSMRGASDTAKDAISQILHGEALDPDSFIAAQNTLHESLHSMQSSMADIHQAAGETLGQLNSDLKSLAGRMQAMGDTIRKASENMGVTLRDVSDLDTGDNLTGKISDCRNCGDISSDLNGGGIAGAVALENDLDPEDDLKVLGDRSLNFEGSLRAVILDCTNQGRVTVKKIHGGGIVGYMTLGLVKNCINTGIIDGEKAQYLGGIAGMSQGYLRSNHVKCGLIGESCVGGIAGSGTVVTDNRSIVTIRSANEKFGAILGLQEPAQDEEIEAPVSGNLYMSLMRDIGAIDGISYQGLAQPMPPRKFQSLPGLPPAFQKTTLSFRQEDGTQQQLVLPMGSVLRTEDIPEVREKEGFTGAWEGIEEYRGARIYFDSVLKPVYTPHRITIASTEVRSNGRPVLLAEGTFPDKDHISLQKQALPELPGRTLLEAWELPFFDGEAPTVLHLSIPEGADAAHVKVLLCSQDGVWREVPFTVDARYLILSAEPGDTGLCIEALPDHTRLIQGLCGGGALIVLAGIVWLCRRRKKARKA